MIVWILIQIAALAVSAFRLPLAPEMGGASERFALAVMLVTQIGAASLFSAALLRDFRGAIVAIVTAWPFALLAAVLADAGLRQFAVAETYAMVWIASLSAWNWALPRFKSQISSAATLISLGGAVLWYLHAEFVADSPGIDWNHAGRWGPILGGLSQILPQHPPANARWFLAALFTVAILVGTFVRRFYGKPHRSAVDCDANAKK
jgi:hypothetical protein